MKRKTLSITFLAILSVLTAWNVRTASTSECARPLPAAPAEALSSEAGTGSQTYLDCSYNRHPFPCSMNGNKKIEKPEKGIKTIQAQQDLDGRMACRGGGNLICRANECADLYR